DVVPAEAVEEDTAAVEPAAQVVEPAAPKVPYVREYGLRREPDETEVTDVAADVTTEPSPTRAPRSTRRLVEIPLLAAFAVLIVLVLRTFVAQAYFIPTD